jgi:hypothetical protein
MQQTFKDTHVRSLKRQLKLAVTSCWLSLRRPLSPLAKTPMNSTLSPSLKTTTINRPINEALNKKYGSMFRQGDINVAALVAKGKADGSIRQDI